MKIYKLLIPFMAMLLSRALWADVYVVNTVIDTNASDTNPGDGLCRANFNINLCSFRAAIEEANADPIFDRIDIGIVATPFHVVLSTPLPALSTLMYINGVSAPG